MLYERLRREEVLRD